MTILISKQDCILLLSELGATDKIKELLLLEQPTIDIIQYINEQRELTLTQFYQKINELKNTKDLAIILVSHDFEYVKEYADNESKINGSEKMDDGTSCKFSFKYKSGEAYAYFAYDKEKWIHFIISRI